MKKPRVGFGSLAAFTALVAFGPGNAATAQPAPTRSEPAPVSADSGFVENTHKQAASVFSTTVRVPGAPWLRLSFKEVLLAGSRQSGNASYLLLTSVRDGAFQILDSVHLTQWRNTSAYFNGDAVTIEIIAFPGTGPNRVAIGDVTGGAPPGGPPELLRAFYRTIAGRVPMKSNEKFERGISVLDPACGSGAFLFAGLQILESLYADCLERMRRFLDELEQSGKKHRPEKYADFKALLAEIDQHPNERYFVLKSIIINNLFGVDIMEEAVEICKLRLFLTLVAQVERVEQIEPLPDIDFNIRAGNTLVGYVSLDEVRASVKGLLPELVEKDMERIEGQAEDADRAYKLFREVQVRHGGRVTAKDKADLRGRLGKLEEELDRYLASEFGVRSESDRQFMNWKESHQPFHWLVEFFGIVREGGFDAIIGNPPYVEYREVRSTYRVRSYRTEPCGNLYAFMWERCLGLVRPNGRTGMIVPVASVCTDGYQPLQALLRSSGTSVVSAFNDRPSKLFDGLEHSRLCVILHHHCDHRRTFSTTYNKWQSVERPHLFQNLAFVDTTEVNRGGRPLVVAPAGGS